MMSELPEKKKSRARNARPKIERAALELFVREGVDAATTREIAELAEVSEGALYRHYSGKDELARSLFRETHDRLGKMMMEALQGGDTLEQRVRRAVSAYCQIADEDWLVFSFHLLSLNRYLPYDTKRHDDPVTIAERLIASMMEASEIPKGDPAIIAAMCLGVVMQAGQNKAYNRLKGPLSDHVDAFTRAIMAILMQK